MGLGWDSEDHCLWVDLPRSNSATIGGLLISFGMGERMLGIEWRRRWQEAGELMQTSLMEEQRDTGGNLGRLLGKSEEKPSPRGIRSFEV